MLRIPSLLAVALLLLSTASLRAGAEPRSQWVVGEPQSTIDRVQFNDGGRCYNSCISGRIFFRCQSDPDGEKENCCNRLCTRLNNDYYWRY
jgi:hypothetical protein